MIAAIYARKSTEQNLADEEKHVPQGSAHKLSDLGRSAPRNREVRRGLPVGDRAR